jgi:transcriptional regulator with XRE-family HTH domain
MYDGTAWKETTGTTRVITRQTMLDVGVVPDALERAIRLRGITAAELARQTGISKSAISMILSNQQTNTTAINVAKLARALNVTADFLMGLSAGPTSNATLLGDLPLELAQMAKQLPSRRQHDLIAMARTYLDMQEPDNLDEFMKQVFELVERYGGKAHHDQLLDLLMRYNPRGLLGSGDKEVE